MADIIAENPSNPFDVDKYVNAMADLAPGHADESGRLKPEFLDQEIKNRIAIISSRIGVWKMKKADQQTIDALGTGALKRLGEVYPDEKDFISRTIKDGEIYSLIPYVGVLQTTKEEK